jgi:cullin 3
MQHVQGQAAVQDTWARFAKAVREIHNNNAHQLSYEEHYRYDYNLCLFKHGEMLYNGVCDLVSQNLDSLVISVITPAFPTSSKDDPVHRSQEGERLLIAFRKVWDSHTSSMSKLRDLLQYMVRL